MAGAARTWLGLRFDGNENPPSIERRGERYPEAIDPSPRAVPIGQHSVNK
jgi:hypothetical protein